MEYRLIYEIFQSQVYVKKCFINIFITDGLCSLTGDNDNENYNYNDILRTVNVQCRRDCAVLTEGGWLYSEHTTTMVIVMLFHLA